jgi:hypothetical protein
LVKNENKTLVQLAFNIIFGYPHFTTTYKCVYNFKNSKRKVQVFFGEVTFLWKSNKYHEEFISNFSTCCFFVCVSIDFFFSTSLAKQLKFWSSCQSLLYWGCEKRRTEHCTASHLYYIFIYLYYLHDVGIGCKI